MGFYGKEYFLNESIFENIKKRIEEKKKKKAEEERKQKEAEEKAAVYKKDQEDYKNMSSEEKADMKKLFHKKLEEMDKLIKSEGKKLMSDSKFVALVRKDLDKAFEEDFLDPTYDEYKYYYKNKRVPKLDIQLEEDRYWIIIDDEQEIRIVCSRIVDELASRLEKITGYEMGTGDGDEGCIYPEIFDTEFKFYRLVYKKYKSEKENK